jgi:type I restriction enzyme S subunit
MSWTTQKLGDVVDKGSSNISINKIQDDDGEYPVFAAKGFVKNVSFYHQDKDYLAIIKDGAGVGRVARHPKYSSVVATMQYLVPKQGCDIGFIEYFLKYMDFSQYINGSTIPHIYFKDYKYEPFPVVPIEEQKRIVAILDQAFADIDKARATAERNLKNARELFDSYLQSIFTRKGEGWRVTTLGEVCTSVEYGSSAKSSKDGKIPVLRMGNIQNGYFEWDKLVYSNNDEEIKKYLLNYNDVLFNRTNSPALVGKTAIYKGEMPALFAGYLIRIHRKENLLDADYLNYYLNSNIALDYGKTVVISSVNQANINGTKLKTYPISLPSLKEQQLIVEQMNAMKEETQRLESIYKKKINALDELKKSILQKAFTGELTKSKGIAA